MIHDPTFRLHGTLRLLHRGVVSERPPHGRLAEPFSAVQAAGSALWRGLPEASLAEPPTETPCPYLEQFLGAAADATPEESAKTASIPGPVYLCGPATSSMDVARVLAASGQLPVWGSVLALSQSSGRGQLGRNWVSPEGNIYAALRLPERHPFTGTAAAPAIGGLIAESLSGLGFDVHMKWPNDLLQRDASVAEGWSKVGGILLEERPLPRRDNAPPESLLMAGIGLNLVSSPAAELMRAQRAVPAGTLSAPQKAVSIPLSAAGLWMRLVSRIFFCYVEEIDAKGKNAWRSLAERRLAFLGQTVLLTDGPDERERHTGILEGLDDFGGLLLRNREGTNSFLSGSLQLNHPPMQP